jgi:hypothetical protein
MANTNPVYLSLEDWETVQRALRDAKQRAILVERDHPNHPRIAHAARVEAERIGATFERLDAQIDVRETG